MIAITMEMISEEKNAGSSSESIVSNLDSSVGSNSFITRLQIEFAKRKSKNPSYSLRSFAKALDVDQSHLSKLLVGKRRPTDELITRMGIKMQLTDLEIHSFKTNKAKIEVTKPYNFLGNEDLALISDWHPFAILEYWHTRDCSFDPSVIGKYFGISKEEVIYATHKLIHLKMVAQKEDGTYEVLSHANNCTHSKYSSEARRKLQKHYLEKAAEVLDTVPLVNRESRNMTIAIDSTAIPEIKRRIAQFTEELRSFINSFESKDKVYQLSLAFFPISKNGNEEIK